VPVKPYSRECIAFLGLLRFTKPDMIIRSVVVDYLKHTFQGENVGIACIYCSYKEQQEQTTTNLIASLVQQLVQRHAIVPDDVRNLYKCHIRTQTRPSLRECSNLLQSQIHKFSKIFVIIDALDECLESNRESLITEIQKLQSSIHLLVTSRHIAGIEHFFENAARLEIFANGEDVRIYLESRIAREGRLKRYIKSDSTLQDDIISTIIGKASGMFVKCLIDIIKASLTDQGFYWPGCTWTPLQRSQVVGRSGQL
jgi:hypothetical protein